MRRKNIPAGNIRTRKGKRVQQVGATGNRRLEERYSDERRSYAAVVKGKNDGQKGDSGRMDTGRENDAHASRSSRLNQDPVPNKNGYLHGDDKDLSRHPGPQGKNRLARDGPSEENGGPETDCANVEGEAPNSGIGPLDKKDPIHPSDSTSNDAGPDGKKEKKTDKQKGDGGKHSANRGEIGNLGNSEGKSMSIRMGKKGKTNSGSREEMSNELGSRESTVGLGSLAICW
ncbi:hypothetical protein L6452_09538 [Arctium lappa]|uniref:Uncharacterized protein n=1 Tax=Arctium lappa TaxID=4217 RepID=A0ACB9DL66_ARCLA|nr:hypothetical protein L6452_09538 [Arctium lappa]